eukprot:2521895-Prymnesium_polylepis.1
MKTQELERELGQVAVEKQMFDGMGGYATTSASTMFGGAAGYQYRHCRCASCPGPASCVSSHGPSMDICGARDESCTVLSWACCECCNVRLGTAKNHRIAFVLTRFTSDLFIFMCAQCMPSDHTTQAHGPRHAHTVDGTHATRLASTDHAKRDPKT